MNDVPPMTPAEREEALAALERMERGYREGEELLLRTNAEIEAAFAGDPSAEVAYVDALKRQLCPRHNYQRATLTEKFLVCVHCGDAIANPAYPRERA